MRALWRASISKLQWLIILVAALSALPPQDAKAACDDPIRTQLTQAVAHFKRVGDCSLLPGIMALSDRDFAYGVSHCAVWRRTKTHAQVERELRAFCRPSSTSTTTAHNNSSNQQSGGAAQPVSPPSTQQQASPLPHQQPASCSSDITGTDDPSSASRSQNCRDANRFLHAARVTREKYPVYADDQYKKAAASARAAGDTELELSILREATSPPAPQPPLEEACAEPAREAAS
jgi:hypothetical protein